jgi:hypothetical protein
MKIPLDEHGQPLSGHINRRRRTERDISELLGLAKGMLSDGVVNQKEANFLQRWGENHIDALSQWPLSVIFTRLKQVLSDGRVTPEEGADLHELLSQLVGGTTTLLLGFDGSTTLPLDNPPPLVCYGPEEVFVFTGKMAYGPRARCEREVIERGSQCESNVTRRTTFLVLGTFGNEDWAHTSYGRKIERAVELRSTGFPLRIVGEDHWAAALAGV